MTSTETLLTIGTDGKMEGKLLCNSFAGSLFAPKGKRLQIQDVTVSGERPCFTTQDDTTEDFWFSILRPGAAVSARRKLTVANEAGELRFVRVGNGTAKSNVACRSTVGRDSRSSPPLAFRTDSRGDAVKYGYGKGQLWVLLARPPTADELESSQNTDGSFHFKIGFWLGRDARFALSAERLDGNGNAAFRIPGPYPRPGFQPVGIDFSSFGCWRVEAELGTDKIAFTQRLGGSG